MQESVRRNVYTHKIAPKEMRTHLLLNASRLSTAIDLEAEIEDYCDAKQEQDEQPGSGMVAGVDVRSKFDSKGKNGKGKKGKDKDKGKMVKGKTKENKGKQKGDKGESGKGKLHKGLGKEPQRREAVRFGGYCNYCWRLGHKEASCWFKQEWQKQHHGEGWPQAAPADKQKDIREYFKKKSEEDTVMDVGAIMQDLREMGLSTGQYVAAVVDASNDENAWFD